MKATDDPFKYPMVHEMSSYGAKYYLISRNENDITYHRAGLETASDNPLTSSEETIAALCKKILRDAT